MRFELPSDVSMNWEKYVSNCKISAHTLKSLGLMLSPNNAELIPKDLFIIEWTETIDITANSPIFGMFSDNKLLLNGKENNRLYT